MKEGPASRSYGLAVAQLAGVPREVIAAAREYLAALETRAEAMDLYEHAGTGPELVVCVGHERVRIEVHDAVSAVPFRLMADPYSSSGRGMAIVDELASDWGVEHIPEGKRVWFEVPFSAAPLPAWARTRPPGRHG